MTRAADGMAGSPDGCASDADDAEQGRVVQLMAMRWRGEREVSRWEAAVFNAMRAPRLSVDVLSDTDKAFLDFLADEAVLHTRRERNK